MPAHIGVSECAAMTFGFFFSAKLDIRRCFIVSDDLDSNLS
jgi:hypothetical protein